MVSLKFSGTKCLIAGGTCDMALTLALKLIQHGVCPVMTYRSEKGQDKIRAHLKTLNGQYDSVYLDLAQPQSIDTVFDKIGQNLDYLVDFAQGNLEGLIASTDSDRVSQYFETNVDHRALLIKTAARVMLQQKKGRMVYVSSAAAYRQNRGQGFYAAAKNASESIYHAIGIELGSKGITTVCIRPGYVDAGRAKPYIENNRQRVMDLVPTKCLLSCDQVADLILYLLTDTAFGINATVITMDGGMAMAK